MTVPLLRKNIRIILRYIKHSNDKEDLCKILGQELKEMEIVVFENQSIYDQVIVLNNPIKKFVETCKRYM